MMAGIFGTWNRKVLCAPIRECCWDGRRSRGLPALTKAVMR